MDTEAIFSALRRVPSREGTDFDRAEVPSNYLPVRLYDEAYRRGYRWRSITRSRRRVYLALAVEPPHRSRPWLPIPPPRED